MLKQLTPERVIHMISLSVALTAFWPLSTNASKTQVFVFKIVQVLSAISALMLLLPLLYATYLHFDNMIVTSKCICLSTAVLQALLQTVISLTNYDRLQRVTREMMVFLKEARPFETEILHKYIEQCKLLYGASIAWIYVCASGIVLGPVILPDPFPTDAEYPFRVNYTPVNVLVYLHQTFVGFQCSAHMCMCIFGGLLLWFTTARFECLTVEVQQCSNIHMLIVCIKKQLRLRSYAKEVVTGIRFMVLNAIGMSTLVLTLSCITLIIKTPLIVKTQFIILSFGILAEIYLYSWPADSMKDMSSNASRCAYNLMWHEQSLKMQKSILYMLVHQDPITLSISCIVPELSLRYYCSYLSNAFSFFTAVRAVIGAD